jgi:hypothetical protein
MVASTGDDRPTRAAERFYRQVTSYFYDLWYRLDEGTRTARVILSLMLFLSLRLYLICRTLLLTCGQPKVVLGSVSKQTHQSLRKDLLEEAYEVLEAIDRESPAE